MCKHAHFTYKNLYNIGICVHSSQSVSTMSVYTASMPASSDIQYIVSCPCLSPMCFCLCSVFYLSVDLSSAFWNLFQFGHSLPASVAPETAQSVDILLSEACGSFRLTYVVNVHPDSQLSGLKVDDHRCNQRV